MSPVCILVCFFKMSISLKSFPQTSHGKRFSLDCLINNFLQWLGLPLVYIWYILMHLLMLNSTFQTNDWKFHLHSWSLGLFLTFGMIHFSTFYTLQRALETLNAKQCKRLLIPTIVNSSGQIDALFFIREAKSISILNTCSLYLFWYSDDMHILRLANLVEGISKQIHWVV